jgi:hypothetical protein
LGASCPHAGDLFFLFFLCFAGLMLGHHDKTTRRTTRRRADTFSSKSSCEAENARANRSYSGMDTNLLTRRPSRTRRKLLARLLGRVFLVRGGNSSEWFLGGTTRARRKLLGVTSRWNYSCETETPRRGFSEELLRESSCARRRVPVRTSLHRETPQERKNNCDK